jgi:hypothetical protein
MTSPMCHPLRCPPPRLPATDARFTSQVADPIRRLATVVPTTEGVIHALQPDPGHAIHHDQASAQPIFVPIPRPLAATATTRFTSKVADPIHGLTAVVPTTRGVVHALQPDPGHAIHHDQASAQPISVPAIVQLPVIHATLLSGKP